MELEYVYILVQDTGEWEDLVVVITEEEAINLSKQFPNRRVEIFKKTNIGYTPTYNFIINGNKLTAGETWTL
jgi:hypothetical protein